MILTTLGHDLANKSLNDIIAEVDVDGENEDANDHEQRFQLIIYDDITESGELDFDEFCTLASRFVVEPEDADAIAEELREAFFLYDKEGEGYITTDVFRDILHELDENIPEYELDMMIEEIDTDGSGTLDFEGIETFLIVDLKKKSSN